MDYSTAKFNLIKLLCVNVEQLPLEEIKKLVKKRYKQWHPDKNVQNPEKYREHFMTLNESWNLFKQGPPQDSGHFSGSVDDLFCDEEWRPDYDSSSSDSDYNSTPFDDDFFNASPKKNFSVPECLRLFFRSKTNRRAGKLFMLVTFCDSIHRKALEEFSKINIIKSFVMFQTRTNKEIFCNIVITHNELRLVDLRKFLRKHSVSGELFYAVNVLKLIEKCTEEFGNAPYEWGEKIQRKTTTQTHFDHKALVDFAISHEISEINELMYEYAHLADPCDRENYTKDHEDDHRNEVENAKKYVNLPDRRRTAKNAIDCVYAKLFRTLTTTCNLKWFEQRARDFCEKLLDCEDKKVFGEAYYYWRFIIKPPMFKQILGFIISVFCQCDAKFLPKNSKKRYIVLRGPYNCGKTTLSYAISKFFDGVTININVSKDRVHFYLGAAIGKRFVFFDDVKGYKAKIKGLPTGSGIWNLDDMREHLDGISEVQLEKKNQNPVNQVFPSGIITMNQYEIPGSLKLRLEFVDFPPSPLFKKHNFRITADTIFLGMAFDNLVPTDSDLLSKALKMKDDWMKEHLEKCTCKVSRYY